MYKTPESNLMGNMVDSAVALLQGVVDKDFSGNVAGAARHFGMSVQTLHAWLNKSRKPTLSAISPVLEKLGAKLILPSHEEPAHNVCFVDAKVVNNPDNASVPEAEDYVAAPLVGEVGAGTGYISADQIESWFLVYSRLPAVRYRKNLIAVQLGKHSNSMQPTLNPGDIVLVDRDDRDVTSPGKMMLVRDPTEGAMIKRVSVRQAHKDFTITYYSDNATQWPPMVYSLNNDFDGDWDKAIVGRVIWAWQDMREK